jgi:DNA-binding LacI/PurR family transcriptional regulator
MAVTLKQIAERANVSVTTVSRILNRQTTGLPIRETTRQRVLLIADELGYKPNLMARALRGSSSSLIGVIVRDISEPFLSQVLKGVNLAAIEREYRVFLGHVERQPKKTVDYGSMFEQAHADGIIVIGDMPGDDSAVDYLVSKHRFIVGITDRTERRQFPGVYTDNELGTRLALEYLWELGHRHIACVSDSGINDGLARAAAYEAFMRECGAEEHINICLMTRTPEDGYLAGERLFTRPNMPTAIFACTDVLAIGLVQAAFQHNIAIPEQVSIIGYDDIDIAAFTVPPLTTICQSGIEMGQKGTNLLLDIVAEQADITQIDDIIQPVKLIVRQSTGQPLLASAPI